MIFYEFEKFCRENKLRIFTINDLRLMLDQHSPAYIRLKINRWKQKGYLTSPKRGLYIFANAKPDEFKIASMLISPSYISLETALSHYSIIPDISAEVNLVTTKNTRVFETNSVVYKFYHIQPALFSGFRHLRDEIFIATPEKAIFDFFYFRKPDKDHILFERAHPDKLKGLDLKTIEKYAKNLTSHTREVFNCFKDAITR